MLLNRESNPGLPRLVVKCSHDNWMTIRDMMSGRGVFGDAYAEIIATRPLGIVVYCCTPMDD